MSESKGKKIEKLYGKRRLEERQQQAAKRHEEYGQLSIIDRLRKVNDLLRRPLAKMRGWKSQREIARLKKQINREGK